MRYAILFFFLTVASCLAQPFTMSDPAFVGQTVAAAGGGAAWSPSDEASLIAWFDPSTGAGMTNSSGTTPPANSDSLAGWTNKISATAYAVATSYPTFQTAVQNSLDIVRFSGTAQYMTATPLLASIFGDDQPMIWAAVLKDAKVAGGGTVWQAINSGGSGCGITVTMNADGSMTYQRFVGATLRTATFSPWDNNFNTYIVVCTGTAATWYTNGVLAGTANQDVNVPALTQSVDAFYLGRADSENYFQGDLGEWMLFNASTVSVSSIHNYLKDKWGTP